MLTWMHNHITELSIAGIAVSLLLPLLLRYVRKNMSFWVSGLVLRLLAVILNPKTENPAVRTCLITIARAFIKLAESEFGGGRGAMKKEWVVSRIVTMIPKLEGSRSAIDEIVQIAFDTMVAEFGKVTSKE